MIKHPLVVKISQTGAATLVYHPDKQDRQAERLATGLGRTTVDRRGAYVYPLNRHLRSLFKTLRRWFGSSGRVADWTREWPCRWAVVLPGEHVRLPGAFGSHAAAVQAEVNWILEHKA